MTLDRGNALRATSVRQPDYTRREKLLITAAGPLFSSLIAIMFWGISQIASSFFIHQWDPYPLVRYTERPDVAANHLLEGHVLIIVDTSPSVIILPTTFFHHLQHAEEYRQTPAIGTFIRWVLVVRLAGELDHHEAEQLRMEWKKVMYEHDVG